MVLTKTIIVFVIFSSLFQNEVCQAEATAKKVGDAADGQLNNQQQQQQPQTLIEIQQPHQQQSIENGNKEDKTQVITEAPVIIPVPENENGDEKDITHVTTEAPKIVQVAKKRNRNYTNIADKYPNLRPTPGNKKPKRNSTRVPPYGSAKSRKMYTWDSPETQLMNSALGKYMQWYHQQSQQAQKPMNMRPVHLLEEGDSCFVSSNCKSRCCVQDSKTKERTCQNMSRLHDPCNDAELKGGIYSDYCPCALKEGILTTCEKNVCKISRGSDDYTF